MNSRPLRPFEQGAHLHVLDWAHDTARHRMQAAGAMQVKAAAKAISDNPVTYSQPPRLPSLEAAITAELSKLYALGHATVRSELDHQRSGTTPPIGLSATPDTVRTLAQAQPDSTGRLRARASLVAADVAHQIWQRIHRARLQGITDQSTLRRLGREAGNGALSQAASQHAGGAISAGRHTAALQVIAGEGQGGPGARIIGARYTSVLDKATCGVCAAADTGELLPLGDPRWVPTPNPGCLGGDRCRCIHVYQLEGEAPPAAVGVAAS